MTIGGTIIEMECDGHRLILDFGRVGTASDIAGLYGRCPARTLASAAAARGFSPDVLWIEGMRALSDDNRDVIPETVLA